MTKVCSVGFARFGSVREKIRGVKTSLGSLNMRNNLLEFLVLFPQILKIVVKKRKYFIRVLKKWK